jgi:hypothetical protein
MSFFCCSAWLLASCTPQRDAALATGVLSSVLAFLPANERLQAGRVSKQWRVAMMQPSLWRDQGWHLTRHIDRANVLPLPSWLCARLSVVRCSIDWLVCAAPFARFRQLRNVRYLDLLLANSTSDMAATEDGTLRRPLWSLSLQSLRLPVLIRWDPESDKDAEAFARECDRYKRFLSVITQPEPNSHAPSPLVKWSASLTCLRCEVELVPDDPMLKALTAQPWPLLVKLQLTLCCDSSAHFGTTIQQLRRALLSSSMPALTWLEVGRECFRQEYDQGCACDDWWKLLLPGVRTLTKLKLDFLSRARRFDLLELLRLVGADAMPQLTWLYLDCFDLAPPSDDKLPATIALLQCMPLTQLTLHVIYSADFRLLHHLPHLIVCKLTGEYAEPIGAAPNVHELTCQESAAAAIIVEWWHRCGRPPLQYAGFVDEEEWQKHLAERSSDPFEADIAAMADSPAPVIRVLRCVPNRIGLDPMRACVFPYLAHLPQLRELECGVYRNDLRALGLLTQLKKLRVWLSESWSASRWGDDDVRTLGALPLHRLRSLRLEGDDERSQWHEGMGPSDPDFLCQQKMAWQRQEQQRGTKSAADAVVSVCLADL